MSQIITRVMIFHSKTHLTVWRAWRTVTSSLHSSAVSASPGPGSKESKEVSSVSGETPPHTPVMLKEVLHYLDIQPAQVCLHPNYLCKPFGVHDFVYVC